MAPRPVEVLNPGMARATTGGHVPVGGRRRPCRRLLPLLLLSCVLVPAPASAATSADAWMSAQQIHQTHAQAIDEAALRFADGSTPREVRDVRRTVATAIRAIDTLEVHACFQVWWSYVRSSYVLFDQALVGMEVENTSHARSAVQASRYLNALADAVRVDCPRDESPPTAQRSLGHRDDRPLVNAPTARG